MAGHGHTESGRAQVGATLTMKILVAVRHSPALPSGAAWPFFGVRVRHVLAPAGSRSTRIYFKSDFAAELAGLGIRET